MKVKCLAAAAIFVLVFSGSESVYCGDTDKAAEQKNKQPELVMLEDKEFDAGKVIRGEILAHTFRIKNEGDADLVIENLNPD